MYLGSWPTLILSISFSAGNPVIEVTMIRRWVKKVTRKSKKVTSAVCNGFRYTQLFGEFHQILFMLDNLGSDSTEFQVRYSVYSTLWHSLCDL